MRLVFAVCVALGATLVAHGQEEEPEVRRAIPVQPGSLEDDAPVRRAEPVDPNSIQNPAWMDRVPTTTDAQPTPTPEPSVPADETPVQRAIPVQRAQPVQQPVDAEPQVPVESAVPRATPEQGPVVDETSTAQDSESGDEEGSIRFAPAESVPNMNQSLLAGNGFYRRDMYDLAIPEYERYLIAEPHGDGRAGALFRLGESYRALGNTRAARNAYQRLLSEVFEGEFVGAGSYRLGQIYYSDENYPAAIGMFEKAVNNTDQDKVKLTAQFYVASGYDKIGKADKAAQAYEKLLEMEGDNPYVDTARFYLAEKKSKDGQKQAALADYVKLSKEAAEPKMKAEAAVKAGALAADLGRADQAKKLFDEALEMPGLGDWRGVARLGVLRLAYEAGRYEEAAAITDEQIAELPKEAVPEALLLTANARRQLDRYPDALAMYDRIMRDYPQTAAAGQAQFQRLVCLDATGAENIETEIDQFLVTSRNPRERAQATLLKAETLFKRGAYDAAAPLYAKVMVSDLSEKLKNQSLYKLGWCQVQLGQNSEAAQSFSQYLSKDPKSKLAPTALAQRAMANQRTEAYDAALKDFDRLIADYPDAKERELALQQKALILGQQEQFDEMVKVFQKLLKEYPETKAAAQADYWIGSVAFDKKDYEPALEALEKARELDPNGFGQRATTRIMLIHYYQEDREAVSEEVAKSDPAAVPTEVLVWLGTKYFEDGDYAKAEKFIAPLAERDPSIPVDPEILMSLARARIAQKKFTEAAEPVRRYLALAKDPITRARGLLASAEISLGTGNYEDANKLVEEALLLQPEGKYNAQGRILSGEVLMQRGDFDGAARAFMMVAVLYDDKDITPKALRRGADAYRKAGMDSEAKKAIDELNRRFPEDGSQGARPDTAKAEADRL